MTATIRHLIGAGAGVLTIPAIVLLLSKGMEFTRVAFIKFDFGAPEVVVGTVLIALAGVVLGAALSPWLSPLASLIPGVLFLVYGLVVSSPLVYTDMAAAVLRSDPLSMSMGQHIYVLLGAVLVTASVWPSRWRTAAPARPSAAPYGRAPYGSAAAGPTGHGTDPHQMR
ncbi:MAG: hypothetical protein M0026_17190 [Nocardiopsaceae bacterium]|nr:hypothetical protein [Nocardiopsaceae bacterium]